MSQPLLYPKALTVFFLQEAGSTCSSSVSDVISDSEELLLFRKPKKLKIVALLDKPDRRVVDITGDFTGFTIPDAFVVGYGLDYAQRYRNLPYVGVLNFDEE